MKVLCIEGAILSVEEFDEFTVEALRVWLGDDFPESESDYEWGIGEELEGDPDGDVKVIRAVDPDDGEVYTFVLLGKVGN